LRKKIDKMDRIIKIILAVILLLCLFHFPYGYYQFVRIAAMVGFAYLAYNSLTNGNKVFGVIFIIFAILFQPLYKIALGRPLWNIVDVIVAVFIIISIFIEKNEAT